MVLLFKSYDIPASLADPTTVKNKMEAESSPFLPRTHNHMDYLSWLSIGGGSDPPPVKIVTIQPR
jgi:hypothetical protein